MVPTCLTKCASVPGFPYNSVCLSYELTISPPVLVIVLISPEDMPGAPKHPEDSRRGAWGLWKFLNGFPSTTVGFQHCQLCSHLPPSLWTVCSFPVLSSHLSFLCFSISCCPYFFDTVSFEFFLKIVLVESY